MTTTDELFMHRALELARKSHGSVSPNPMVGCVIVHQNRIIGEGRHEQYGQAHAEVQALNSVTEKHLLSEATAYVTLEPCSHFGKTPPCADRLIAEGIRRVVICNDDPNPLVAGKGIQKLREAGIEVDTGILSAEGRQLNRRFFTYFEKNRPYIILKWAETADGFLAGPDFQPLHISNTLSRRLLHKWRTEEDAFWVGTNTTLYDNPQLNVRYWEGNNPVRITVDRNLTLPPTHHFFDDSQKTLIYTQQEARYEPQTEWIQIADWSLEAMIQDLRKRSIQSVVVEGGTKLLESFIQEGLADEIRIFRSPMRIHTGIAAPKFSGHRISQDWLGEDELSVWTLT